ncbi:MAG: cell envelope integrity protein TolA [Alphaproteobacteria bacterium]|nr:cell envelope integrity protein TolA [Alphaproteobacteria bacterium]
MIVSIVGHIGFVMLTMLAWEARSTLVPSSGAVVPIEIVDVADESNVRALAIDRPDEEVSPTEDPVSEEEEAPAPSPEPAPQRPRQNQEAFDPAAAQGLVDHSRQQNAPRQHGETADRDQQGAGAGTAEVAALRDRVISLAQRHLMRCWRMPVDRPDPESLIVTVQFELDRNGNLRGPPRVTSPRNTTFNPDMQYAVNNAILAVQTCDPYPYATDPVLADHYEVWSRIEFTFRPRT